MNNYIQEYIIDTDIQEYIIDTLINNHIIFTNVLKHRLVCKHWDKYIYKQLFKLKNDDLNKYFSAMRICHRLSYDSISFKKILMMYEITTPNYKELKYKCSKCGKFKLTLGDYQCCKTKYQLYKNTVIHIINGIYIGLFYIIFINFINYILIHTINNVILKMYSIIDILKIIILLL